MVLESLVSPIKAETHPGILFIHGLFYATIGLFLGLWIFSDQASMIVVFLTTMAAIPLIYNIIKLEEKKDLSTMTERGLLKEHSKALKVFMYYFLGATVGYAIWYLALPNSLISTVFSVQTDTILHIRTSVTGNSYQTFLTFTKILSNNLKVLIFCVLFSFLYGVGAIFILTWNASVIGVAIGETIRQGIAQLGDQFHWNLSFHYIPIISYGLLRYTLHGLPEIGSYFVAGLAGGIISRAAIRHDFGTRQYEKIVMDSAVLLLLSLFLLVAAAFLEVYVTPIIF